ncbi:MAG: BphX family protein [Chloroflexi bacterium]|nr:BphX family protein [Chloroflexota bacterium]
MNKLKWWFRIVGAFYLLLALMNMYGMFINRQFFASVIPFPADEFAVKAFVDGWSPFAFEILGIATFMLWASRDPLKYLGAVWLIVWLELLHGVVDDVYLIANGYDAVGYLVFIVVHLIIIGTGVMFTRQASVQTPARASVPMKA